VIRDRPGYSGGDLHTAIELDDTGELRWYGRGHRIALDIARGLYYLHSHEVRALPCHAWGQADAHAADITAQIAEAAGCRCGCTAAVAEAALLGILYCCTMYAYFSPCIMHHAMCAGHYRCSTGRCSQRVCC
jgi:hypothetical protein